MKNTSVSALVAGSVLLLAAAGARASLLVYEGFNGYSVTTMNGQMANASTVGLTGAYATTIAGWGNTSEQAANYNASGLSLGTNFTSTGGAMTITARNTGRDFRASVALSADATSALSAGSTLYGSFLFKLTTASSFGSSTIQQRIADSAGASTGRLQVTPDGSSGAQPSALYNGSIGTNSSYALAAGTTYLFVSRFTNVGTAGGGTENVWLFDQASYDLWFTGGADENSLAAFALSSFSNTNTTQADFSGYLQFRVATGNPSSGESPTHTGVFDELRYATTLYDSLALAVPEPLTLATLSFGCLSFSLRRRTHKPSRS